MHASFNLTAPSLSPQLFQSLVQRRRVSPHVVERDAAFSVDEVCRVCQPAINLVRCACEIIHQHRPPDAVLPPVRCGVSHLLFKVMIGGHVSAGVRLTDDDIYEADLIAPSAVKFVERLDRACRDRSGERAEMKQDGLAPQVT